MIHITVKQAKQKDCFIPAFCFASRRSKILSNKKPKELTNKHILTISEGEAARLGLNNLKITKDE